ncbi:MAG: hypothetical protein ACRCZP_01260, partial [Phycicoccus sp.]
MHEYVGAFVHTRQDVALVPDHHYGDQNHANADVTESWAFGGQDRVRWYLTSTPDPGGGVLPGWEDATGRVEAQLRSAPQGASQLVTVAETSTSGVHDVCLGRWRSGPATRSGELSGAVNGDILLTTARSESDPAADLIIRYTVYVVDAAGTTVRAGQQAKLGLTEVPTTIQGVEINGSISSIITVQPGDRLVVEVGYRAQNTDATTYSGSLRYGGAGNPDLAPGDIGTATERAPWIELTGPYLAELFDDPATGGSVDGAAVADLGALTATAAGIRSLPGAAVASMGTLTGAAASTVVHTAQLAAPL